MWRRLKGEELRVVCQTLMVKKSVEQGEYISKPIAATQHAGANAFVAKPHIEELLETIKQLLNF
jgi:hypothetical protein